MPAHIGAETEDPTENAMTPTRLIERRAALPVAVTLLLISHAIGCGDDPAPPPPPPQPVKILTVPGAGSNIAFEYPGEVSASQHAEPAFEVSGKIIDFPVIEGQTINEGDIIAALDPRDYEAALDRAAANLKKAAADVERYQILFDKGVSPKTELERAQRLYDVADAERRTAEKAVEDSTLRAQFSGTVAKKLVADFENVTAKQSIIILQDESTLEVVVGVPEQDYAVMKPGLTNEERTRLGEPKVTISSIPGRSFDAYVKEFTTTADPITRTFKATLAFRPPDDITIRPGMTAKISITPRALPGEESAVLIPARALLTDPEGQSFVWTIDAKTLVASRTDVLSGVFSGENVTITQGLEPGNQIAVSGVHKLSDGMVVRKFGN
jgi:RND family efflux transporter MFP subunit